MGMRLRWVPLVFLTFVAACPCNSSAPGGGRPARGVELLANVADATGAVTTVFASLHETRGDPYPRTLSVSVGDPAFGTPSSLAGHVVHLRLLDGAMQVVQEITTSRGDASTNSILTLTVFFASNESARYDAMRALFLSGKTMVEIDTDIAGREQIRMPFTIVRATDWVTPSCD